MYENFRCMKKTLNVKLSQEFIGIFTVFMHILPDMSPTFMVEAYRHLPETKLTGLFPGGSLLDGI